jgi:uncharacterized protein YbjT (DUF2867 family)
MSVNYETDLLLVTCGSGKQGSNLLPLLVGKWKRLRLAVHSSLSEERLRKAYPNAEVIKADIANPQEIYRVIKGVVVAYHIGPTFHPYETEIGYHMIDAAIRESREGCFKHFVFSSVVNTQFRKMMNHDCKRIIEEYLMESGLNFTILQPSIFMDFFPVQAMMEQQEPVWRANWDPSIPFCFTAQQDLAEVASLVLDQREKHYLATYPVVSTTPLSYNELIEIAGKEMGKTIRMERKSFEEAVEFYSSLLFGAEKPHPTARDTTHRMLLFYNQRGLVGNPNIVEWLLKRPATSFQQWLRVRVKS